MMRFKFIVLLLASALALVACGGNAGNKPVDVKVTLKEFAIESSITDFRVGVPYHFVVTNAGEEPHEIMLMEPMENSTGMSMEEMDSMALAHVEEDDLPPGGTATFDYTFTQPAASGKLEFACHIQGHYESGMKLPITVE